MRLLYVRHGHPDYANDCLTALGHRQAEAASRRLAEEKPDRIFSSPQGRARETAAHTTEKLGMEAEILPFMHEIDFYPENCTEEQRRFYSPWPGLEMLTARGADVALCDLKKEYGWENPAIERCFAHIAENLDAWLAGLGYEREGTLYRCKRENEQTLMLFAHHGSGCCLISYLTGLPLPYVLIGMELQFTSVSELRFPSQPGELFKPMLELLNDARHIRGIE